MNKAPADDVVLAGFEGACVDSETGWLEPSAFIQWKGTDVCMDFHCQCGAFCHFDGDFAYIVQCPHCSTIYEMPCVIYPRAVTEKTCDHWQMEDPKILQADHDREPE